MTRTTFNDSFAVVGGQYFGTFPHSFGVPPTGAREHPLESSTTVALPFVPVIVLNDAILVTKLGPSTEGRPESTS